MGWCYYCKNKDSDKCEDCIRVYISYDSENDETYDEFNYQNYEPKVLIR